MASTSTFLLDIGGRVFSPSVMSRSAALILDLDLKDAWTDCKLAILSFGRMLPDSIGKRTAKGADSVPWGVAIGAGTLVAYYFDPTGRWAGF